VLHDHRIGPLSVLRGDDVVVPAYALHRHPAYWPQPETFDAARWDASNLRTDAFLPFVVGWARVSARRSRPGGCPRPHGT
jgi:cytochrome P450